MSDGTVNAHTHLYSALAPYGMPAPVPPPESFVQILERIWWRLDRALDAESLAVSARLYAAESLALGTTTVFDHHESPNLIEGSLDLLADACADVGLEAVLCYGVTERNFGHDEARRGLREGLRFLDANTRPLVRGVLGIHASFTVSDETLREVGAAARAAGVPVHVHLAEDQADVTDARARGYAGPLERLLALDALTPGSILAHGVHLSPEQVRRAHDAGCWLVNNPRSNANNRVGCAQSLAASGRVALGTDGFPADMLAERDAAVAHAGCDATTAQARLDAGLTLRAAFFGPDRPPRASPETAVLESLRADARRVAPRLFERMKAL